MFGAADGKGIVDTDIIGVPAGIDLAKERGGIDIAGPPASRRLGIGRVAQMDLGNLSLVSLQDTEGDVISTYDVSAAPAASAWVDPLARQIQY